MKGTYKKRGTLIMPAIVLPLLLTLGLSITLNEMKKYSDIDDSVALASTFFTMPDASKDLIQLLQNEQSPIISQPVHQQNEQNVDKLIQKPSPETEIIENIPEENTVVVDETPSQSEQNIILNIPDAPSSPNRGIVITEQYTKGSTLSAIPYGSGFIKNVTGLSADEVLAYASEEPEFNILKNGLPQVLIYHTHTTECYLEDDIGEFDLSYNGHTENPEKNMVRIGEEIVNQLEAIGIEVIHEKTIHDYSYNGSYGKSAETVENILAQYPSIEIALDIHRDAIVRDDSTIIKPTASIDGKNAAQVMIISGCDNGSMNMPNWSHNLRFAARLQDKMESMFPGLTRPILFDYRSYNQRLTNGSLLIEVGSHANTLDEAIYAGELVGKALAAYLEEVVGGE